MTSRDDAHHRVAGQFPVSLALDCRSPVAGASAGSPEDDRVRRAGQNARQCTADLRPNPAAARLILIPQHIDKLIGAVGSGPLDARALDLQRVVLLAGPSADAGETDGPDHALLQADRASLCCALLPFMIGHAAQNRAGRLSDSGRSLDGRPGRISRAAIATLRELGADWSTWPLASTAWSAPARRAFARPVSAAPSGAS